MPMELRSRRGPGDISSNDAESQNLLLNQEEDDEGGEDSSNGSTSEEFVMVEGAAKTSSSSEGEGTKGDRANIAVLLFLYILQGIPLGLAAAVPLILTARNVSYKQQAEFSFAYWPFSVKLLWAPIVDACFVARFGRRKTWLVPTQYLIGITMLALSRNVSYYLGEEPGGPDSPDVLSLTCMFFFLNFLAATQDIAVDGWALTMLQRRNVGYASTCNSVGQTAGYFFGYVCYIALESYGLVTLSGFLFFWGIVFLVATTLVAIFKHEKGTREAEEEPHGGEDLGVLDTFKLLGKIVRLPHVQTMMLVLLTVKIGFSSTDSVAGLKFVEKGVPKDKLAMLSVPMMPLQLLLPLIISRFTNGPRPMDLYLRAFLPRLLVGLVITWAVWVTPGFADADGHFPWYYYGMIVLIYALHQICLYSMFVSHMAFHARVSDPAVGGTYMTLLNTVSNLGGNWPATLALWCVDTITSKECAAVTGVGYNGTMLGEACDGADAAKACVDGGGKCEVVSDGFYIESFACFLIGLAWLSWGWRTVMRLQAADTEDWRVVGKKRKEKA